MVGEKNYVLFKTRITVNMRDLDLDLRGAWGLGIFALRGEERIFLLYLRGKIYIPATKTTIANTISLPFPRLRPRPLVHS